MLLDHPATAGRSLTVYGIMEKNMETTVYISHEAKLPKGHSCTSLPCDVASCSQEKPGISRKTFLEKHVRLAPLRGSYSWPLLALVPAAAYR